MAQVQQGTASNAPSSKLAVVAAGIAVAVAAVVIAAAIAVSLLSRPATGSSTSAQGDPLTSKAAIEFRAAERAVQAGAGDSSSRLVRSSFAPLSARTSPLAFRPTRC